MLLHGQTAICKTSSLKALQKQNCFVYVDLRRLHYSRLPRQHIITSVISLIVSVITMAPSKFLPSAVQKECQRVIHFNAHNEVFQMEDLTDEQKKNKMFMLVHGNNDAENGDDDQLSLNSLFLNGKHQFMHAFDRETICVTDDNASTNEILVLKEVLHRQRNTRYIVGEHITERHVSSSTLKGTNLVEGRTIKNDSELAKRNALKCIAFAKIWMKGTKNDLPSGQIWDDFYEHVYSCMERSIKKGEELDDNDATSPPNASQQIQSGLFAGWMVFVLLGPYGPEPRHEVEWIQESPNSSLGPGCNKARKIKIEDDQKRHHLKGSSSGIVAGTNALPFEQKVMAASIAQREESDVGRRYDSDLMCHQLEISNLMKQKELHLRLMEMKGGLKSKSYEADLRVVDNLDQMVEQVNEEMRHLQDSFKKRRRNPVVTAVIDLVSSVNETTTTSPTISSRVNTITTTPSISSKLSSSMSASVTSVYEDCSNGDDGIER